MIASFYFPSRVSFVDVGWAYCSDRAVSVVMRTMPHPMLTGNDSEILCGLQRDSDLKPNVDLVLLRNTQG